jgi:hypothetical protein
MKLSLSINKFSIFDEKIHGLQKQRVGKWPARIRKAAEGRFIKELEMPASSKN